MSRLHLTAIFFSFFFIIPSFGQQNELRKYLEIAQEKYSKGDYIHALTFYDRAMAIDSNSINTLWNYAETLRAYKDYRKAEYYYDKVFSREGGELYPLSIMYLGLMQKHNAKYDNAIETFKRAKKVYRKDKSGYLYNKSKQELESCLWAKNAITDTSTLIYEHLPEHINTANAEFGHRSYNNTLVYSSLRGDSVGSSEEVYTEVYKTHLFQTELKEKKFGESQRIDDLYWKEFSTGNGSWSPDGTRFYFSMCDDEAYNYKCKIMVANYIDGKFKNIDSLGYIVNERGKNSTMPHCAQWDNKEVLFFASNRDGGKGGMDIWFSYITNGNQYSDPVNLEDVNTADNELSPFWDNENKTLYFSSSWHYGFGGYDIFSSKFSYVKFEEPKNLGFPINSPANDLYYFKTLSRDTAYFSSNRLGTNYAKNPTCCSDIFMVRQDVPPPPPTVEESLEDLMNRLPVTLYFHNDIPNPRSWATTSNVNYIDSYNDYTKMLDKYKKEYSAGLSGSKSEDAKEDIDDFFTEYVDQGVRDLFAFRDLLLKELERGRKIQLTVKGFASPLAKSDYNVNLTKRRIASLVNYLKEYDNGVFRPYFDGTASNGGSVSVVEVPFGEYTSEKIISDNPNDVQNSIYSRVAARERKIEIQSVDILREEDTLTTLLSVKEPIHNFGEIQSTEVYSHTFTIENRGDKPISILDHVSSCPCLNAEIKQKELAPNEKTTVLLTFDPSSKEKGRTVEQIKINYSGAKEPIELMISAEVDVE